MLKWLISTLITGLVAGWGGAKIMGLDSNDWVKNLLLGLVGSFVGGLVGYFLGLHSHNIIGSIILALIGSIITLWAYNKYVKK